MTIAHSLGPLLIESLIQLKIAKSIGGVYPDLESTRRLTRIPALLPEYLGDARAGLDHDRRARMSRQQSSLAKVRIVESPRAGLGKNRGHGHQRPVDQDHFRKESAHEFYVEGKFSAGLDVSASDALRRHHGDQLPAFWRSDDDVIKRDHEFWSQFSQRLIGTGNPRMIRPSRKSASSPRRRIIGATTHLQGRFRICPRQRRQEAFSKLRSSIAGGLCLASSELQKPG